MTDAPQVIVIGAGVVGASAAWRLVLSGAAVTVLDQFESGHQRGSSHGPSRIFRLAYPEPEYVRLGQDALGLWRELEQATGRRVLSATGALDHGDELVLDALEAAMTSAGVASERLSAVAAHERWPGLHFESSVLLHPDGGRLHADDAVAALLDAATAGGATVRRGVRVQSIDPAANSRVELVTSDGEAMTADRVVVAAGGWAPTLTGGLPMPPLRVTQEQTAHFALDDRDAAPNWPSFIHHWAEGDTTHGVTPAPAGIYGLGNTGADGIDGVKVGFHAIGPTVDPDHVDRTPDEGVQDQLQRYAAQWLPGVDPTSAVSTTCLYTLTPDHHFVIDRDGPVVVAAGFSGHGFKFGPALGELIARLAIDGVATPALFAFGDRTPI